MAGVPPPADHCPEVTTVDDHRTRALRWTAIVAILLVVVPAGAVSQADTVRYGSGTHLQTDSGLAVELANDRDLPSGNPFSDSDTLQLPGGELSAPGSADVRLTTEVNADTVSLRQIDATGSDVTVAPSDSRPAVSVGGDVDQFDYRRVDLGDAPDGDWDFRYEGDSGQTKITISDGLPPDRRVAFIDIETEEVLAQGLTDSSGAITLTVPNSEHLVDIAVPPNQPAYATNPSPDDTYDADRQVELSFTAIDPESSDIDVRLYRQVESGADQQLFSTTVTNGSEVSYSYSAPPGETTWYAELTDGEGVTERTRNYTFRTPGIVDLYEAPPFQNLSQDVTVIVRQADGDYRREETVTGQELDLVNAPDDQLVIRFYDAGSALRNQTLAVNDPADNTSAVIYKSNNQTYSQLFALDDKTGIFEREETIVRLDAFYDGSYRSVSGDRFSAGNRAGVALLGNETYRLVVRNEDGDVRSLGDFEGDTALDDTPVDLTVTQADTLIGTPNGSYEWDVQFEDPDDGTGSIVVGFDAADDSEVDEFELTIYRRGNESQVLFSRNYGSVDEFTHTEPLTDNQTDETWVVEWTAVINGQRVDARQVVGSGALEVLAGLDDDWQEIFSVAIIILTGSLFSTRNVGVGAVVTVLVGGLLWFIGFISGALTGGGIALALLIALLYKYATGGP